MKDVHVILRTSFDCINRSLAQCELHNSCVPPGAIPEVDDAIVFNDGTLVHVTERRWQYTRTYSMDNNCVRADLEATICITVS